MAQGTGTPTMPAIPGGGGAAPPSTTLPTFDVPGGSLPTPGSTTTTDPNSAASGMAAAAGTTASGTDPYAFNAATAALTVPGTAQLFGTSADLKAPAAMAAFMAASPSVKAQIQYQMYQSGMFYTQNAMPNLGTVGPADEEAFKRLVETTADSKQNIGQYLAQAATTGQKNGTLSGHAPFVPASGTVTLTNSATLQADVEKAFIAALGEGATQKQIDTFVKNFQGSQVAAANDALVQKNEVGLAAYMRKYGLDASQAYDLGQPSTEQKFAQDQTKFGLVPGTPSGSAAAFQAGAPVGLGAFMKAIASHESGGNYQAVNTSSGIHSGAYQMSDSMWNGFGGYAHAYQAPPQVQDAKAAQVMTSYYNEFGGNWGLVAAAWNGGPGTAEKAAKDPNFLNTVFDGATPVSDYVQKVMSTYGRISNDPAATALASSYAYDPAANPSLTTPGQLIAKQGAPNPTAAAEQYAESTNPTEYAATRMAGAFAQIEDIMHGTQTGGTAGTTAPAMP